MNPFYSQVDNVKPIVLVRNTEVLILFSQLIQSKNTNGTSYTEPDDISPSTLSTEINKQNYPSLVSLAVLHRYDNGQGHIQDVSVNRTGDFAKYLGITER